MKEIYKDLYIIGGGESLKDFDFDTIKDKDCMVINATILICPQAKYFVALDKWVFWEYKKIIKNCIRYNDRGMEGTIQVPKTSVNLSGYTALMIALKMDYDRIFLIGFDGYGKYNYSKDGTYTDHTHQKMIDACEDIKNERIFNTNKKSKLPFRYGDIPKRTD